MSKQYILEPSQDTIFALSTPPGEGGIAVVRISGEHALSVARRVFRTRGQRGKDPEPRKMHRGDILGEGGKLLDDGIMVFMPGPRSYTGEDLVEIHIHGSPVLVEAMSEAIHKAGARPAQPGEFTLRAYLRGKLNLTQAEAVIDLVRAQSREGLQQAARHLHGSLGVKIEETRERLISVLANLEAEIDFPEEIEEEGSRTEEREALRKAEREIQDLLAGFHFGRITQEGLRVAIVGKPNVGKSSLFNALLGRRRALVDREPGTTRDVVESASEIGGKRVVLYDTAGRREAAGHVEAEGMAIAEEFCQIADGILFVLDGSEELGDEDRDIAERLARSSRSLGEEGEKTLPIVVVVNKSDLPLRMKEEEVEVIAAGSKVVRVSALTSEGLDRLRERISFLAGGREGAGETWISNLRHYRCLEGAAAEVRAGMRASERQTPVEFVAEHVRAAVGWLGEMLGNEFMSDREEVLNEIFSRFCLGK